MTTRRANLGCVRCGLSRRQFMAAGCVACAGAVKLFSGARLLGAAETTPPAAGAGDKMRIRVVYSLHGPKQTGPDWPNKGFDFVPVMDRINAELAKQCTGFEFIPSLATGADQAKKILADDQAAGNIEGYLIYQMNCWNAVVQTFAGSGKPVLYADFQFAGSGGFLVYTSSFLRAKSPTVGFVASSKMEDLVAAVKCFQVVKKGGTVADFVAATTKVRTEGTPKVGDMICKADEVKCLSPEDCIKKMKESKILAVRGNDPVKDAGKAPDQAGVPMEWVTFDEVNEAWKAADKEKSAAVADRWQKEATEVLDVTRATLESSAAMYLGMKAVMAKHNANAITVNCLGGFYGGHIHAYPCLGFHELNNEGLIGGCECDTRSAGTMVIINALTQGRPGYISDPVIDTAKRQIIYAHCVAHNKAFGPQGATNPYTIMTHSEDRQGASIRSVLPVGYMTTSLEIDGGRKQILMHQAKSVGNDPDDRACRTKMCGEPVGDIEKLFTMWDQWSWHRVTAYGDLKKPVAALAEAMAYKVVEEA